MPYQVLLMTVMCHLLLAAPSGADAQQTEAQSLTFPYRGIVSVEQGGVYAGAGHSYYVAGQLAKGQAVEVHAHFHSWFKIAPPEGVYSYVRSAFVNRAGDGAAGTVTRDGVVVTTAALAGGPGDSYRIQRHLAKDAKVQIVAKVGDFYKIRPPTEVFVFLPPGTVTNEVDSGLLEKPVADPEAADLTPPAPPITVEVEPQKADTEPVEVPVVPAAGAGPAQLQPQPALTGVAQTGPVQEPDKPEPIQPLAAQLIAAEMQLEAILQLPLQRQPLEELLATYQALAGRKDLARADFQLVATRVRQLHRRYDIASTLDSVSTYRRQLQARPPESLAAAHRDRPTSYAVVGELHTSAVYDGRTLPLLYRVVQPNSHRTLAYVRPASWSQAARHLGKLVGVMGEAHFDDAVKVQIVEAERLDLLAPVVDAAAYPMPSPPTTAETELNVTGS